MKDLAQNVIFSFMISGSWRTYTGWKIRFAHTFAPGAKMQMPWMQHICYSANSRANVIDNIKHIQYTLYLKTIFVMPWLKSIIASIVVKHRYISQQISFSRHCLRHLHMNSHDSKCVAFTALAFWHRVQMYSANLIFHPVHVLLIILLLWDTMSHANVLNKYIKWKKYPLQKLLLCISHFSNFLS